MTEMISILNSACVQLVGIACGAYILKCEIPEGGLQRSARKALDIVALTAVIRIITGGSFSITLSVAFSIVFL